MLCVNRARGQVYCKPQAVLSETRVLGQSPRRDCGTEAFFFFLICPECLNSKFVLQLKTERSPLVIKLETILEKSAKAAHDSLSTLQWFPAPDTLQFKTGD
jgi:hypothetical protein